ncbi:MAG: hypothetical protein B7Y02_05600, partial [Rhodobacterales bacterium 17-64-5]
MAPVAGPAAAPDLLIPAADLIDGGALLAAIRAELPAADARAGRAIAVRHMSHAKNRANAGLEAAFLKQPLKARALVSAQSHLTDVLVTTALLIARDHLHRAQSPTAAERLTVLAVGGFGRGEMAPHSDVDLLFLTPWKITPWAESVIESMLYMLWDLKLKVGHSSRTVADCIRLGREDITIRTALLEHRFIAGDASLAAELNERLWSDLFRNSGPEFIEAKLAERAERHKRQGGQRYVLEPNVKEAKGGLRDLQTLYWIGKYLLRVSSSAGLVGAGLLSREEYDKFERAENFLWAARCHLHYITHRAVDQLTFDAQVDVAARMGYHDAAGRRAVELFMQDYFRHATHVGELTRIFLTELEARHAKPESSILGMFSRKRVKPPYKLVQSRIDVADPAAFLSDPKQPIETTLRAMMTTTHLGEAGVHPVIASAARELLNKSDNERSGV